MSDRLEVHEALGRYARALDEGHWSALADMFSRDGTWGAEGMGSATGGAAIVKLIQDIERDLPPQIHIITNQVAELDGDRAALTAYVMVMRLPIEIWAAGKYDITLAKEEGRWKFKRMAYIPVEALVPARP